MCGGGAPLIGGGDLYWRGHLLVLCFTYRVCVCGGGGAPLIGGGSSYRGGGDLYWRGHLLVLCFTSSYEAPDPLTLTEYHRLLLKSDMVSNGVQPRISDFQKEKSIWSVPKRRLRPFLECVQGFLEGGGLYFDTCTQSYGAPNS